MSFYTDSESSANSTKAAMATNAERAYLTKTFKFDAAHVLRDYTGLCNNLHGHTYRVDVCLSGIPRADGMLMDFNQIKKLYYDGIIEPFDHAFICGKYPPDRAAEPCLERSLAILLRDTGSRTANIIGRPTAENIAKHLFLKMLAVTPANIILESVKVWETETACAEVRSSK